MRLLYARETMKATDKVQLFDAFLQVGSHDGCSGARWLQSGPHAVGNLVAVERDAS